MNILPTSTPIETTEEPKLGDHLVSPRTGYTHHGIYSGGGKVIHYSGLADGLQSGAIEETTLEAFSNGRGFTIRHYNNPRFKGRYVVDRALSRLEEDLYCVRTNNCEHFCEWCINDEHSSEQVNSVKALAIAAALVIVPRLIVPLPVTVAATQGDRI